MITVVLGLFGIIFGSFVNALVWRLHEQGELAAQRAGSTGQSGEGEKTHASVLTPHDLSIMKGRSMCPDCHHTLAPKDLVPILSWLSLRGKCRYCRQPISWQYPLVELATGGLFALSYAAWPHGLHGVGLFELIVWLVFVVAFMALAVYDLRWFLLPDKLVRPLVLLAAGQTIAVAIWTHQLSGLWQPALGAALIFGLFYILFQVSKGAWIGGGDVKLAIVLGLLVGSPLRAFLVIFISSLLGTFVSIPLLAKGRAGLKLHIPYGPYLLAATAIVVLYGGDIVNWYQKLALV